MTDHPPSSVVGAPGRVSRGLEAKLELMIAAFWQNQQRHMASTSLEDLKSHSLPIARVKKVMRSDEDAMKNLVCSLPNLRVCLSKHSDEADFYPDKMISGETPMLLAKAAEIFIEEMTLRAWMHAEEDRRRTLNRSDFAQAVARSDMFDFLIDIVPRDEEWIRGNSAVVEAEAGPNGNNGLPSEHGNVPWNHHPASYVQQPAVVYQSAPHTQMEPR